MNNQFRNNHPVCFIDNLEMAWDRYDGELLESLTKQAVLNSAYNSDDLKDQMYR